MLAYEHSYKIDAPKYVELHALLLCYVLLNAKLLHTHA
jgi:hypothetical protein